MMNKKKIGLAVVLVLIIMQFFTIDKTNKIADPSKDLIAITKPNQEVAEILKTSCYDCHSNQTRYPWYANIAPVSWWLKSHVDEASEHLNFSNWGNYSLKKQDHKLEELYEEVEEGEMPLPSYTWLHNEANLSEEQKEKLITWSKSLRAQLK